MGGARSADRPPPIHNAFRLFILFLLVRIECDAATASFDLEKVIVFEILDFFLGK